MITVITTTTTINDGSGNAANGVIRIRPVSEFEFSDPPGRTKVSTAEIAVDIAAGKLASSLSLAPTAGASQDRQNLYYIVQYEFDDGSSWIERWNLDASVIVGGTIELADIELVSVDQLPPFVTLSGTITPGGDAADVNYDNSGSGLTATDVQAAIDEIALTGGATIDDTAYPTGWDGDTTQGASRNALFDKIDAMDTTIAANTAKVSADGSVTTHSDVTDAGSGAIITSAERTNLSNQSGTNTGDEPAASTTVAGVVELATDGENAANVAVQGNDSRLSDARTPTSHASTHVSGAGDEIDGDTLDIDYSPTNYTQDTTPGEVTTTQQLTAHIAGIDNALATAGGGQAVEVSNNAAAIAASGNADIDDVDVDAVAVSMKWIVCLRDNTAGTVSLFEQFAAIDNAGNIIAYRANIGEDFTDYSVSVTYTAGSPNKVQLNIANSGANSITAYATRIGVPF